jgi:hypothetical protein
MAPQRRPLEAIDVNRASGSELSSFTRGQIGGLRLANKSYEKIGAELQIPKSTVQYTLEKIPERLNGESKKTPWKTSILG